VKKNVDVALGPVLLALSALLLLPASVARAQVTPAPSSAASKEIAKRLAPPPSAYHEDLTSISVKGSHFVLEEPVRTFRDDRPDFVREVWQVAWRPADPLDLYVIIPKKVAKPPVILFLYSWPTNIARFRDDRWCMGAVNGGYAAVGFLSALTGDRTEYKPVDHWFVGQLSESLVTTTHDVSMILDFLAKRGDLDMDHVGMFGEGSGGTIAILAAAADPRIKAIEALDSWGDWPHWLAKSAVIRDDERSTYLKPDFLAQVAPFDPIVWLPKMQSTSILVQNLRPNPHVPEICQKSIEAAAPDTARIEQFGDGRAFISTEASGGLLFRWLKDQLKPGAKPVSVSDKADRIHYYPAAPSGDQSAGAPSTEKSQ
jgi:hypothetical protein